MNKPTSEQTTGGYFAPIIEPVQITEDLKRRLDASDAAGSASHGATVDRRDLSPEQWLDHATDEMLDAAKYLQAAKRDVEDLRKQLADANAALAPFKGLSELLRENPPQPAPGVMWMPKGDPTPFPPDMRLLAVRLSDLERIDAILEP